ncbi:unnamed protein product [Haemonchus placei]|uniref:Uncharacterized protein n=1 Tax=Haemonchus placei TaxID=6290 RepID=A0A3P7YJQ2_HAEPC|nr:unnamed protein product [Haemonchus placei]
MPVVQYDSVSSLRAAILSAWNSIPENVIQNRVDSMPNRILEVIREVGGLTKY